jgi:DNA polymerase-3 subunit gamma/tau
MEILGASNFEVLTEFVWAIINGDVGNIFTIINKLCSIGKSMGVLTKDVNALIRDLLLVKTCEEAEKILLLPESKMQVYKQIAGETNEQRLLRMLEVFSDAESLLKYTNHPRVVFETAAIKASTPENDYNIEALTARIKTLEDKIKEGVKIASSDNRPVNNFPSVEEETENKANNVKDTSSADNVKASKISDFDEEKLTRKLSYSLEKQNSELLAGLIESSQLVIEGKQLTIVCNSTADVQLLETEHSKLRIKQALSDFEEFSINVVLSKRERELDEIDKETDRIRKIFGDDIVITN